MSTPAGPARRATSAASRAAPPGSGNDLYATHDGTVYRNTGSGWQQNSGGGWGNVSESTRTQSLNQEQQIRSNAQTRVNNYRASGGYQRRRRSRRRWRSPPVMGASRHVGGVSSRDVAGRLRMRDPAVTCRQPHGRSIAISPAPSVNCGGVYDRACYRNNPVVNQATAGV